MTIPKDLAKKRDELASEYIKWICQFDDDIDLTKRAWLAGYKTALSSEHVLALVEALELAVTGTPESGLEKYILTKAKEALAKWSKRNE